MAMKAVGWLSQSLGLNIAGRSTTAPDDSTEKTAPQQASNGNAVETYLSHVSSLVFGGGGSRESCSTSSPSNPFAASSSRDVVENAELDEQGLPKTRNWYYYDDALGRWNVHPGAPQAVKDEFEERLRQEEIERNKANSFPEPPPPPPPAFNPTAFSAARSPLVPQYAVPTYFGQKEE